MEAVHRIPIFSKSKVRIAAAVTVAVILIILTLLAVQEDGLQIGKLYLALLLSVLAGVCIAVNLKIPEKASTAVLFIMPFPALCCMEFFTHVPWDLTFLITILNYTFFLLLYIFMYCLLGTSRLGSVVATLFPMLAGTLNYFVVSFRSSPIVPWDIYSAGTAASIADNYEFSISFRLLFVLFGFTYLMILGEKTRVSFRKWKVRLAALAVSALLMAGFIQSVQTDGVADIFGLDDILFTPNVLYRNNGFMVAFLANMRYLAVEKPEGYSVETVKEIAEETQSEKIEETSVLTDLKDMPNIIVIMNEAFSDLSVYGDFSVSEEYMPFFNSLQENTVQGNLYMSVKGGNTANAEFEFLTGNSMAFLPAGSVPYQQYIKSEFPSLAGYLGSLGYRTAALHPYYASGWNRDQVYEYLGFEESYFKDDFTDAATLRGYVDDKSAFDKVIELYEEKDADEKLFAFEVTMQNHGGYSKEYSDLTPDIQLTDYAESQKGTNIWATEKYLTLIKKTDEAFEDFIKYFAQQEEDTIILMFGDHQPSDYICNPILNLLGIDTSVRETSVEEFSKGYIVPFVMWANYDLEEEQVDYLSANYLSGLLMDKAHLPKTDYQTYLAELQKEYPVITANFYMDGKSGQFHELAEGDFEKDKKFSLNAYSVLQYNDLCDTKQRVETFFGGSLLTNE